ncbi:flavoprotein [Actinoplanes sp. NPDC051343]|uniref:flavoprotein n=1 Tax=Actinoplanes sp. NPDC051343 TaxID=3363906 RepID=UPI0037BBCB52
MVQDGAAVRAVRHHASDDTPDRPAHTPPEIPVETPMRSATMPIAGQPVLYLVACGGRPAGDLPPFVTAMQAAGWDVCVIATPSAVKFMDLPALGQLTGHPVRYDWKQPDEPDVLPPADAFVIAPATFNTINKMATGASDTLALGLLNEAIGMRLPIIAVPTPNMKLARHPAFDTSVALLRSWGVDVMFDPTVGRCPCRTWALPPQTCSPGPTSRKPQRHWPRRFCAEQRRPHCQVAAEYADASVGDVHSWDPGIVIEQHGRAVRQGPSRRRIPETGTTSSPSGCCPPDRSLAGEGWSKRLCRVFVAAHRHICGRGPARRSSPYAVTDSPPPQPPRAPVRRNADRGQGGEPTAAPERR